jgi:multidrug resistance efflux pump
MADSRRVPVPLLRRVQQWRARFLVAGFWAACLAAALWLSSSETQRIEALGIVEAREWSVAAVEPARITSLAVNILDPVEAGQVLVTLDNAERKAELEVVRAELELARATLRAESERIDLELAEARRDRIMDRRRLLVDYEEARLEHLDRLVTMEVNRAQAERIEAEVRRQRAMADQGAVGRAVLEDLELQLAALRTQIRGDTDIIRVSEEQLEETRARIQEAGEEREADRFLEPLRAEIDRQEARVRLLLEQERKLVLRAPSSGIVHRIDRRPGEIALAGEPILSIADPVSSTIMVYLDEETSGRLSPGDRAVVRSASGRGGRIPGRVVKVGSAVTERPPRFRLRFDVPEWGIPATVTLTGDVHLVPGQRVRVSILSG